MPNQSNPSIQYLFATDATTGQTVLHSYNYTPIPNRPEFDNFVANDLIGASFDGFSKSFEKLLSGAPKTLILAQDIKFGIINIPLDYAENLYNDKLTTGTDNWKNQISAGIQTFGDKIVGDIGATAGLSVGGYAAAALGVGTIANGGLVLGGAIGGAYLTSKAFDASGIKPEIGNLMQNMLGLTSNDSGSSIFTSGNYITYDAGNQTKFMSNSDIAKQIAIDGLLGNQTPDINGVLKSNNTTKINIKNNGTSTTYDVRQGDASSALDKGNFILKDTDLNNYITTATSPGGSTFTMFEHGKTIPLKDGSNSTLSTVLDSIDHASQTLQTFITKDVAQFTSSYQDYLTKYKGQIVGDLIARLILGESLEEAMIAVAQVWAVNALLGNEIADKALKDLIKHYGADAQLADGISGGIVYFISTVLIAELRGDGMNGAEYTETAIKAAAVGAMQYFFPSTPVGAIVAAMDGMVTAYEDRGDLNAQGWQDLGVNTAAAVAAAYIGFKVGMTVGAYVGSIVPVVGTFVGAVVGAVVGAIIGAIIYVPLKNLFETGSDAYEELYDAVEDVLIKMDWSINNLEENARQAVKAIEDIAKALTIDLTNDVLISIYNLFGGSYGKKLEAGEYWNPYSYLKITPKLDANGNPTGDHNIIGIEPEGVVAIAREYFHDDIYGNSGSDNLIGKSGTNTIMGYEGNDHLEGRGDVDLLIGGKGDDEVFGGNGNDQIYGSEGADNLFGGNGDDVIVGDTGTTLTPEQLAEIANNQNNPQGNPNFTIYNDFIQAGAGNDQIMGEYGNDTIQGNAGDDIILGGQGNDRIEGNEGDDSILGEDGDDTIIAGDGNDIIDGGAGIDIIYGNEGNDNIRGGDDNDEIYSGEGVDIIYGDSGNDLINSGADNDLVFGGISNDIIYGADGDDTLSGEIGNDYLIGAEGTDTIDGGANDDVILGGSGNDTITTGEGNDTIIFRIGDGNDTVIETDSSGNDVLRLSGINSKLSDNTTNKIQLTKSGNDLLIQFKDDTGSIIAGDSITIKDQFTGSNANGTGAEILKKIEFADGYSIDLTALTTVPATDGQISLTTYNLPLTTNIDTAIQEELILGYNDQMQIIEDQDNPTSTYNANNYNTSGEQEQIDSEKYNEMQWRSYKKNRSIFGGAYTVWYKYYEKNLSGTNGNDRIVGHWWSENVYGFIAAGNSQQKQPKRLFLAINENQPKADLGRESSSSRRRRKAMKR